MKILLVGDTHAATYAIEKAFDLAVELGCDKLFQLGDFGFYPRNKDGVRFLKNVNTLIERTKLPFYFLGGNHEDWDELDKIHNVGPVDNDGFHMYKFIRIAPRAHVWEWGGLNFISMSGAYSIDKDYRTEGIDWFSHELPDERDLTMLAEKISEKDPDFHPDVMLAHDAPVNLFQHMGQLDRVIRSRYAEQSQRILDTAVTTYNPSVYVHGHWHIYYKYFYETTQCVGLDMTSTFDSKINVMVLDTDSRTLDYPAYALNTIFELP